MQATLSAVFKGIDEISAVFDKMANAGARAVDQWDSAGSTASKAFEQAATGAGSAAKAMEVVASSADETVSRMDILKESFREGVRYWVEAEKEAAPFTEMLSAQEKYLEELQTAYINTAAETGKFSDATVKIKDEIGQVSAKLNEYKKEYEDLSKEAGKAGDKTAESINMVQSALVAAGIAKLVSDITNAVVEMANEFSNASSVIAKSTGAVGSELDSLNRSMLNVYSTSKVNDMSQVAGAIGEINTRLNLQGSELEHVTGLFIDYSRITNTDVVGSVQSVSKVMKNWDVGISETEKLLDKLSRAGQISGISVDLLSDTIITNKAALQGLGYNLDESIWVDLIGNADGTLFKTANASTTLEEKWTKAFNSLGTAFSNVLTPAIDGVSSALAEMANGFGDWLQKNEWAVRILTGIGVALGVVAVALAGYTLATTIATAVTTAFGVASMAALWPLYLVAGAIGAVVAIGGVLVSWLGESNKEFNSLTAVSKQHYKAIEDLEKQYEAASVSVNTTAEELESLSAETLKTSGLLKNGNQNALRYH